VLDLIEAPVFSKPKKKKEKKLDDNISEWKYRRHT
jgi:hypothetical protein